MLTSKEVKQLVVLLKKIDKPHEGLPQPFFDALCKVVPFVACELVVVDKKKGVLLTWRHDALYRGWHFPGGLLRYKESFEERIQAVAWIELGINLTTIEFIFVKDFHQAKRGHIISLVFHCETAMTAKRGKFFKKMPKNIIDAYKELWQGIEYLIKK